MKLRQYSLLILVVVIIGCAAGFKSTIEKGEITEITDDEITEVLPDEITPIPDGEISGDIEPFKGEHKKESGIYKIKVFDKKKQPLTAVTVKVMSNGAQIGRFYTNKNGRSNLKFSQLGTYEIKIWKKGFNAEEKILEITSFENKEIPVILSPYLKK